MNHKRLERQIAHLNKKIDRLYDKLPKAKTEKKRSKIRHAIVRHQDVVKFYRAYLDIIKRIEREV